MRRALGWVRHRWYVVLIIAVSATALVWVWVWSNNLAAHNSRTQQQQLDARQTLIAQNNRIIECTTPGDACYDQGQARQSQVLGQAFAQLDCLNRRALAGLPAPDPTKGQCSAQTPPNVYPGGTP